MVVFFSINNVHQWISFNACREGRYKNFPWFLLLPLIYGWLGIEWSLITLLSLAPLFWTFPFSRWLRFPLLLGLIGLRAYSSTLIQWCKPPQDWKLGYKHNIGVVDVLTAELWGIRFAQYHYRIKLPFSWSRIWKVPINPIGIWFPVFVPCLIVSAC